MILSFSEQKQHSLEHVLIRNYLNIQWSHQHNPVVSFLSYFFGKYGHILKKL